jgi:FKBP-type peptidyl-prolyl cis-trans isomerase SlpA
MSQIGPGSHVTLHYRLAVVAGGAERELFSTFATHPATLQIGAGHLAAPLERHLVGLEAGCRAAFELDPAAAFGPRHPDLVQTLSSRAFAAEAEPGVDYAPGDVIEFNAPSGRRFGAVLKQLRDDRVTVDFNHPLAGLPVLFSVHVIGVL